MTDTTDGSNHMTDQVPIVSYLVLDDGPPHLVATACTACDARFLGRRIACASCGGRSFEPRRLPTSGTVGSFSIIHRAAKGVPAPFVSAIVDLDDGTTVKANLVGVEPTPEQVRLGMPVALTTYEAGRDDAGTVAVAFAFTRPAATTTEESS